MCVQNDHTDMTILRGDDHIASSDHSGVTWITKGGETRGGRVIGLSEIDHFARSDRSYSDRSPQACISGVAPSETAEPNV